MLATAFSGAVAKACTRTKDTIATGPGDVREVKVESKLRVSCGEVSGLLRDTWPRDTYMLLSSAGRSGQAWEWGSKVKSYINQERT